MWLKTLASSMSVTSAAAGIRYPSGSIQAGGGVSLVGAVGYGFDQVGGGDDGRSLDEVVGGDAAWSCAGAAGPHAASVGDEVREDPPGVGELAAFDELHPGAVDLQRNVVLRLARHGAGMATDARVVVDEERVAHHGESGSGRRRYDNR